MNCWQLIASDYRKYKKYGGNLITILFFTQGFWAIVQFRLAHAVYKMRVPILKQLLQILSLFWQKAIEITTGISIPAAVQIGHSFYIGHFGGVILNARTVIGNNCNISQGVTIGVSGLDYKRGVPAIGNNVYIGANAVVVGNIVIADNVLIAACSLLNTNATINSVMLGVPAIKVSEKSSEGYI
jgi:serine O-acetyltransferase